MAKQPPPASALKNVTGGGGCGCGCLGLLFVFTSFVAIGGIYLEFYDPTMINTAWWGGIGGVVVGIVMFFVGVATFVASIFLD